MRSPLISFAPASVAIASMRPSTCAGTPESIRSGAPPSRSGHILRTSSWLPPIPPVVAITACAVSENSPADSRPDASPRLTPLGASTVPDTPVTAPPSVVSASTRWRKRSSILPRAAASRTRRSNGATTPGPVPHVMWKRGTELPWPSAR